MAQSTSNMPEGGYPSGNPVTDSMTTPFGTFRGVFTYHNDKARTGQNLRESVLTPDNVNSLQFGKLFSFPVDGFIYAQPLYMAKLRLGGQLRNVVFVPTEHDSVYAFDANTRTEAPLWHTSFIDPSAGVTTVSSSDVSCDDIVPEIGITGTPVIDPGTRTIYVVAKTKENGRYVQRVHALDITTGADKVPPAEIQAKVPGTGDGSDGNGRLSFDPLRHNQRAALLLSNGVLLIGFGSHCDNDPYHGWLLAYNPHTLHLVAAFSSTPDGARGGIWQAGGGPAADAAGHVFVMTGNGTFDASSGGNDFGDSILRLNGRALVVSDYFTPFNQADLEAADLDLGSGTPLLLPDQPTRPRKLLVAAGKEGTVYLVKRKNMGHFQPDSDSQIVQSLSQALGPFFGTPAYFKNTVYFLAAGDVLKAYTLRNGLLGDSPAAQSTVPFGFPGATPTISASGNKNGIVWALQTDQYASNGPAVLHAYSAANVGIELYNSEESPGRDNPGPAVKFTVPTVAKGKVYVGTQNQLSVFGLIPVP